MAAHAQPPAPATTSVKPPPPQKPPANTAAQPSLNAQTEAASTRTTLVTRPNENETASPFPLKNSFFEIASDTVFSMPKDMRKGDHLLWTDPVIDRTKDSIALPTTLTNQT